VFIITLNHSLEHLGKLNENHISSLLKHKCPLCDSEVADTLHLRIMKYNTNDDIILLSSDLQISISQTDKKIAQLEAEYKDGLSKLSAYEKSLGNKTAEVNDVMKHQGLIEVRDSITSDLMTTKQAIEENSSKSEEVKIYKEKFEAYKEDLLRDVLTNYSELDLKDYIRIEATSSHEGLPSLLQIGNMNTEVESLIDICWEKDDVVLGEKWLFVKGDKGYFLYKTPDGSDVMRQIKRNGELWEVEKESVREGQKINWIE